MTRAAIVIGVDRAGSFPVLPGAASGADRMGAWLRHEGFKTTMLTDARAPVTTAIILAAADAIVHAGTCTQLVVYFAGHGFVRGYSEFWLLSDAPRNPNEAINVHGSIELARNLGIPSVVFISDACRSVVASLAVQRVSGSEMFPNEDPVVPDFPVEVDRFFATHVGEAALDLRVEPGPNGHDGIYSHCFRAAFDSPPAPLIHKLQLADKAVEVVPNRRLRDHLRAAVPAALASKNIRRNQQPNAIVESGDNVYIGKARTVCSATPPAAAPPPDPALLVQLRLGLLDRSDDQVPELEWYLRGLYGGPERQPSEPSSFTAETGFRIIGSDIAWARSSDAETSQHGLDIHVAMPPGRRVCSVVICFAGGTGTVLAALDDAVAVVVVEGGRVLSVTYTPTKRGRDFDRYQDRRDELTTMRRIVTAAARLGHFRLDSKDAGARLAQRIFVGRALDPTLGLHTVYAHAARGDREQVSDLSRYMAGHLGGNLYDLALLAGDRPDPSAPNIAPFAPMLSQGWPLLASKRAHVPEAAKRASEHLLDALWTTFARPGMDILRTALEQGELP